MTDRAEMRHQILSIAGGEVDHLELETGTAAMLALGQAAADVARLLLGLYAAERGVEMREVVYELRAELLLLEVS